MMNSRPASSSDVSGGASLPATMVGRPFGADESGRPVGRTKGYFIRASVEYMLDCVAKRTAAALPPDSQDGAVAQAKAAALEQLLARLNAAILDPRYHVTADYLMNADHTATRSSSPPSWAKSAKSCPGTRDFRSTSVPGASRHHWRCWCAPFR
jgi:hypothetical protein